jgi:hypothetical protein
VRARQFALIAGAALALAACEGPTGPAGPPGTANVMYSDWLPIQYDASSISTLRFMRIAEPRITREFLETGGSVLMQLGYVEGSARIVYPLPMLLGTDFLALYLVLQGPSGQAQEETAFIQFAVMALDPPPTVPADYLTGYEVRYVLVPGGVPLSAGLLEGMEP